MVFILSMIIVILLTVIGLQFYLRRKMNKHLKEMLNQLSDIIDKETAEKVLMQTDQITIKLFLFK